MQIVCILWGNSILNYSFLILVQSLMGCVNEQKLIIFIINFLLNKKIATTGFEPAKHYCTRS